VFEDHFSLVEQKQVTIQRSDPSIALRPSREESIHRDAQRPRPLRATARHKRGSEPPHRLNRVRGKAARINDATPGSGRLVLLSHFELRAVRDIGAFA
jgi:hypothetical protein